MQNKFFVLLHAHIVTIALAPYSDSHLSKEVFPTLGCPISPERMARVGVKGVVAITVRVEVRRESELGWTQ